MNINKNILYALGGACILIVLAGILIFRTGSINKDELAQIKNRPSISSYLPHLEILKETGDVYYTGKDEKRYVFANRDVFLSWFPDAPATLPEKTIKEMEASVLGGQESVRPGTIIRTESDPNSYIEIGGKTIKKISGGDIAEIYGTAAPQYTVQLPNYFFTAYTVDGTFEASDAKTIVNNQDLELNFITR